MDGRRTDERSRGLTGLGYALAAYAAWGIAPLYFKALRHVSPAEIVAHRVVWSVAVLLALTGSRRRWPELTSSLRDRRVLGWLGLSTLLLSCNWLLFVWAIHHDQLLQASLGYFINPLVNVALGTIFLGERLNRAQRIALLLAVLGVANLVLQLGSFPLIALTLATTFGLYGLIRKRVAIAPASGTLLETAGMAPIALAFLALLQARGELRFLHAGLRTDLLLLAAGPVTTLPLLWFTHGARRLRLSTLGLVQYVAPTGQFLLAVLLYGEPFTAAHAVTFAAIWLSLGIYSADAIATYRIGARAPPRSSLGTRHGPP